jgi:hypothetical protein
MPQKRNRPEEIIAKLREAEVLAVAKALRRPAASCNPPATTRSVTG